MAGTQEPTVAQRQMVAADDVHDTATPETSMMMGHASATNYAGAATATARKLSEQEMEVSTRPMTPPTAQSYQRPVPSMAQPRGVRHGNSFIPPKPVDPRAGTASAMGDLFGTGSTAPAAPAVEAEKPVKKSPSLFERFTMQRSEKEKPAVTVKTDTGTKLSVEEGGAPADDELDIPAFLRRQAN